MSKFLIAGLGNIGPEYQKTRHNIGFDILDAFVKKHGGSFESNRLADVAELKWRGKIIVCIKPTTYMNLSGKAVKYWRDHEKVDTGHLLVVTDDLALPLNKIRLKPGGSDGGHNGLRSIHESLGTTQYPRLRFGIGNEFQKGMQVDFVLGRWTEEEKPIVEAKLEKCVETIENVIVAGINRTMNQVNNLAIGD